MPTAGREIYQRVTQVLMTNAHTSIESSGLEDIFRRNVPFESIGPVDIHFGDDDNHTDQDSEDLEWACQRKPTARSF